MAETFQVVMNDEEQYSLWRDGREPPPGWKLAGKSGTEAQCLTFIEQVWTDMRPRSVREYRPARRDIVSDVDDTPSLLERLSSSDQPVEAVVIPGKDEKTFRRNLLEGYIQLRFAGTRGGTQLLIELDRSATRWSAADADGVERVSISGTLTLDDVPCLCSAELLSTTLTGLGRLSRA